MIKEYKTLPEYVKFISHEEKLNKNTKIIYFKIRAQVGVLIDSCLGSFYIYKFFRGNY